VETCYKVFRTDLLKSIPIRSERFGLEPELAMKAAKRRLRLYEVPISYHGRTYEEGKKIGWKDGLEALGVILRFWLIDDLYVEPHGKGALVNLTRTPAYLNWITSLVRPRLGDRVLEIGAGNGAFAGLLMGRRTCYVAGEADPFYLHALRNRFLRAPSVRVCALNAESGDLSGAGPEPFDSALCLNVLEGMERPERTLQGVQKALAPGGVLVVLAPQHPRLYGSVDETLGQMRRFARARLVRLIEESGFAVTGVRQINKAGVPMWWLQSRVLRRRRLSKITLKLFDKSVWLWRLLDRVLPWPGLSLLIFARRRE
jgi:SAM-dependent methyltransferase